VHELPGPRCNRICYTHAFSVPLHVRRAGPRLGVSMNVASGAHTQVHRDEQLQTRGRSNQRSCGVRRGRNVPYTLAATA
jgi:hypothetical protein